MGTYISGINPPPFGTAPPTWALNINGSFTAIDSHDHTPGMGAVITEDAISFINDFNVINIININNIAFDGIINTTIETLSAGINELYIVDGIGNLIQATNLGEVNVIAASGGGFGGDYVPSGAMATYTALTDTYQFLGSSPTFIPSTVTVGNLSGFKNVNMSVVANIFTMALTAPVFNLPLILTGGPYFQPQVVAGDPVTPGNCISLGTYNAYTTADPIGRHVIYYDTVPSTFQSAFSFYTIMLDALYIEYQTLQTYIGRSFSTGTVFISQTYSVGAIGGVQGSVQLYQVQPGTGPAPTSYTLSYSDNIILLDQYTSAGNFWSANFIVSQKLFAPTSPFGGP